MSDERLKRSRDWVKVDSSLQDKQRTVADSDVVSISREAGVSISADGLKSTQPVENLEDELDAVDGANLT